MFYDKKIKYVDVYENGEKVQNAGFVKMEVRGGAANLWIQVAGLRTTDTMTCPILILSEEEEALLGEIALEQGTGIAEFVQRSVADLAGGISYEELQEIQIRPAGKRLLRCVVQEPLRKKESLPVAIMPEEMLSEEEKVLEKVSPKEVAVEEASEKNRNVDSEAGGAETTYADDVMGETQKGSSSEESEKEVKRISENRENKSEAELLKEAFLAEKRLREAESVEVTQEIGFKPPVITETAERQISPKEEAQTTLPSSKDVSQMTRPKVVQEPQPMDKWHQLLAIYPHIRPFEDRREYLLMKPQDFVVLTDKYFSLSGNSFLLHGYYNYDHLIMCKERRPEGERFYIGVPGNFYDKEKQVAIMFGFESFEGKREPAKTGDFGYYLIPVEI